MLQRLGKELTFASFVLFVIVVLYWPVFEKEYTTRSIQRDAYNHVVRCTGVKNPQSFWAIRMERVKTPLVEIPTDKGILYAAGFYEKETNTIILPERYADVVQIVGHEYMHALGYVGHSHPDFIRCGLDASQIEVY